LKDAMLELRDGLQRLTAGDRRCRAALAAFEYKWNVRLSVVKLSCVISVIRNLLNRRTILQTQRSTTEGETGLKKKYSIYIMSV